MTTRLALILTWLSFGVAAIIGYALAQPAPGTLSGCLVVGSAPTYTAGQIVSVTCNTSGQLRMSTTP
jgi:hypothetical protein